MERMEETKGIEIKRKDNKIANGKENLLRIKALIPQVKLRGTWDIYIWPG